MGIENKSRPQSDGNITPLSNTVPERSKFPPQLPLINSTGRFRHHFSNEINPADKAKKSRWYFLLRI